MAAVLFPESIIGTTYGVGYKLYFYEVGTTTDLTVYSDFALTTAHAQPVEANSDGEFPAIYLDATGNDPKVVLDTDLDVEVWTLARFPIEDITTLSSDLDTAEADITALEGRMTTAESDIDTLETESADYETRISTNETDIAALQGASTPTSPVAMCFFNGENNPTFLQNSGFDSVSKTSDGVFELTFTTARANANYIVVDSGGSPVTPNEALPSEVTDRSTTGFTYRTFRNTEGSPQEQDRDGISLVVFDLDV